MILQKAITPQLSDAYFEHNFDRVFGFVMPWATTSWARTPADLIRAHALDFPGTPFSADMPYIDVLRFEATPNLLLEDATGGPDRETQKLTGGPFIDRPPFTGSGFVADPDHIIPVSWMPHTRVPAGTEIYRLGADGSSTYLAYFHSAAWGWIYDDHLQQQRELQPRLLTKLVGGIARVGSNVYTADLIDDGANTILVRQDDEVANGGGAADGWSETTPTSGRRRCRRRRSTSTTNSMRACDSTDSGSASSTRSTTARAARC